MNMNKSDNNKKVKQIDSLKETVIQENDRVTELRLQNIKNIEKSILSKYIVVIKKS